MSQRNSDLPAPEGGLTDTRRITRRCHSRPVHLFGLPIIGSAERVLTGAKCSDFVTGGSRG